MDRWTGRVAVIVGSSSGIGAATAKELVKHGMKVVGFARRVERVEALAKELKGEKGKLYPIKTDISNEKDILSAFEWIKKNLGGVDVILSVAAAEEHCTLTDTLSSKNFRLTFDINIVGSIICTRETINSMKSRGVDDGHILFINSVSGHYIPDLPGLYPHAASKHALTELIEGLRRELVQEKSKIRVSSVSPGAVDTEALEKVKDSLPPDFPMLKPKDMADAIIYILGTPPHVQVHELTIRPVGEDY